MENTEEIVKLLGTPLGVMAAMLFTGWRIARWLAPFAEEAAKRHFAFMDTCGKSLTELNQKTDALNQTVVRAEQKIDLMHGRITATAAAGAASRAQVNSPAPIAPEPR